MNLLGRDDLYDQMADKRDGKENIDRYVIVVQKEPRMKYW